MKDKIAEILRDYPRLGSVGVSEILYDKISDRIISLLRENIPAENDIFEMMPKEWVVGTSRRGRLPKVLAQVTAERIRQSLLQALGI